MCTPLSIIWIRPCNMRGALKKSVGVTIPENGCVVLKKMVQCWQSHGSRFWRASRGILGRHQSQSIDKWCSSNTHTIRTRQQLRLHQLESGPSKIVQKIIRQYIGETNFAFPRTVYESNATSDEFRGSDTSACPLVWLGSVGVLCQVVVARKHSLGKNKNKNMKTSISS